MIFFRLKSNKNLPVKKHWGGGGGIHISNFNVLLLKTHVSNMRKSKCLVEIKSVIMYLGMCYAPFYPKQHFFCEEISPK